MQLPLFVLAAEREKHVTYVFWYYHDGTRGQTITICFGNTEEQLREDYTHVVQKYGKIREFAKARELFGR